MIIKKRRKQDMTKMLLLFVLISSVALVFSFLLQKRIRKFEKNVHFNGDVCTEDIIHRIMKEKNTNNYKICDEEDYDYFSFQDDQYIIGLQSIHKESKNVISYATVAHEVGHFLQHSEKDKMYELSHVLRKFNTFICWTIVILLLLYPFFDLSSLIVGLIALYFLFSIPTIIIEVDASIKACRILGKMDVLKSREHSKKVVSFLVLCWFSHLLSSFYSYLTKPIMITFEFLQDVFGDYEYHVVLEKEFSTFIKLELDKQDSKKKESLK